MYEETNKNKVGDREKEIWMLLTQKQNLRQCSIPLNFNADIYGDGGPFRIWTSILLGHLLHQVSASATWTLGRMMQKAFTLPQGMEQSQFKPGHKELRRRGPYLTRRTGKYWWLSSSCEAKHARTVKFQN